MLASNLSCCTTFFMATMLEELDIFDVFVVGKNTLRTVGGYLADAG